MSKAHTVEMLDAGWVMKSANTPAASEKLVWEARQIRRLCTLHPQHMVAVELEGMIRGRSFYVLDKAQGRTLSSLLFDGDAGHQAQCQGLSQALEAIVAAIARERNASSPATLDLLALLEQEWAQVEHLHDLLNLRPTYEGNTLPESFSDLYRHACRLAASETFQTAQVAHLNFHFGNVIVGGPEQPVAFIDPDVSLRGLDPLFGLARFAFSFWHEIATEGRGTLLAGAGYRLAQPALARQLAAHPALRNLRGLWPWVDAADRRRLYALTLYCFLRSIRLNAGPRPGSGLAAAQETLALGGVLYLGGALPA